jgi:hypothetical protein
LDAAGFAAVFEHNLPAAPAAQPIWPWLTLAAVLLLPLDVAARRLTLTRRDWARAWEKMRIYELGIRNKGATTDDGRQTTERAEGMAQLLRAKERVTGRPVAQAVELVEKQKSEEAKEMPVMEERPPTAVRQSPIADERLTTNDQRPTANQSPTEDTLAARLRQRRKSRD